MEQDNPARQAAIEADEEARSRIKELMEWEAPVGYRPFDSAIGPDEGRVLDKRQDPTHPLRKGRI